MSKADQIRQAYSRPEVRARIDQDSAADRNRSSAAVVKKARKLVDAAAIEDGAVDDVTLETLADGLAGLITLDRGSNGALIRELLPAYIASRAAGR